MESPIPVVEFLPYSLEHYSADDDQLVALAGQIIHAFSTTGFVYLSNHGIPTAQIEQVFQVAEKFFSLPKNVKEKYAWSVDSVHGWVALERESINPSRPGDLKEAFSVRWVPEKPSAWPTAELPEFQDVVLDFFDKCKKLSLQILELVARGLHLKDAKVFVNSHALMGTGGNPTALRLLHYPPVPAETKPGQVRCGEHSDYGAITLLFQQVPGLEVLNRDGVYVPAPIIENAVLVNIGDLMQRWTSDRLVSTKHRVLLPTSQGREQVRQ
ncbi:Hypp8886 [Branchiostoma lanceolatum]|uniref:Hypp8886 protein n=1 Tax=Branchiostoma lanceolatum TaxID=7740 RepID=A0A8K0EJI8_BRALA|nr:Hypp8886 [Branchiostoma lanceolatum]